MSKRVSMIAVLRAKGFDKSRYENGSTRVECSQCEALVVQGAPCHEPSCVNAKKTNNE